MSTGNTTDTKTVKFSNLYFNSTNSIICFGNKIMPEVVSISVDYQAAHTPFYGYKSVTFDAMPVTRSIVVGTITVNYVANGLFYAFISVEVNKNNSKSSSNDTNANNQSYVPSVDITSPDFLQYSRKEESVKVNIDDVSFINRIRPEMKKPFDIKIISFRQGVKKPSDCNSGDDAIIIKDVYIDTLSRARSIEFGVVKDTYTFKAKTLI